GSIRPPIGSSTCPHSNPPLPVRSPENLNGFHDPAGQAAPGTLVASYKASRPLSWYQHHYSAHSCTTCLSSKAMPISGIPHLLSQLQRDCHFYKVSHYPQHP